MRATMLLTCLGCFQIFAPASYSQEVAAPLTNELSRGDLFEHYTGILAKEDKNFAFPPRSIFRSMRPLTLMAHSVQILTLVST